MFCLLMTVYNNINLRRKKKKELQELKKLFIDFWERNVDLLFPLFCAFIGCFLYVPWTGIEPAALAYWDNALTNWATQPGLKKEGILNVGSERCKPGFSIQSIWHHYMPTETVTQIAFLPKGNVLILTSADWDRWGVLSSLVIMAKL